MEQSFPRRGSRHAVLFATLLLCTPRVAVATATATPSEFESAEKFFARGDYAAAIDGYAAGLESILPATLGGDSAPLAEAVLAVERLAASFQAAGMTAAQRDRLGAWIRETERHPGNTLVSPLSWRLRVLAAIYEPALPEPETPAVLQPLGFLRRWHVVGPFDNDRGSAFLTALPPEANVTGPVGELVQETYEGKKRAVRWRALPSSPPLGIVDLAALYRDNEQVLAYALTFVRSARAQNASLRLGSADGFRLWVNGALVASNDVERPFRFDQETFGIRLEEGWNAILLKVAQSKGEWKFTARIAAPDGGQLEGYEEAWPGGDEAAAASAEGAQPPATEISVVDRLRHRVEKHPDDARAHYLLGAILAATQAHDRGEHPDTEALEQAIAIDDSPGIFFLDLAASQERESSIAAERDDNAWRSSLLEAMRRGSASAAVELGSYYLATFGNTREALRLASEALTIDPHCGEALRLIRDAEEHARLPATALRFTRRVAELPHRDIATALAYALDLEDRGARESARSVLEQAVAEQPRNPAVRLALVDHLLARGLGDQALERIRAGAQLHRFDTQWPLLAASVHSGRDALPEAIAMVERALRIRPDDERLHERLGKLRLRAGLRDPALAAFEQALSLQPNLPSLREYVEFLRATKSDFEERFRQDVAAIAAEVWEKSTETPQDDPSRILLDVTAIRVGRDGTTKSFYQHAARILNDRGLREYDRFPAYYVAGEQVLEYKAARVLRPDGSVSEAKLSRHGYDAVGDSSIAEFGTYQRAIVDLPPISVGDVVEVQYVREDVRQGFFGDYFGHREVFQQMVPIRNKRFVLEVPAGREFYFHSQNLDIPPTKEAIDDEWVRYTWDARDLAKLEPEPGMAPIREVSPWIEISTFKDWEAFSNWYWNLIRRQYESSPELKKKVVELTSGLTSETEKIRAIYNFVVTDIRYNAWEFGVHGFKPYNAATIFSRRFGDCKDKSTLLSVMLREVGIAAYPVLIRGEGRRGKEDLTLPLINHFNHCISYVPASTTRGELFLDGTAQHHPLEQLPSMDRGASVLIVGDGGEGLVHETPWNSADEFAIVEDVAVKVRPDLSASLQIRVRCGGDYAVYVRRQFEIAAQRRPALEQLFARRFAGATVEEETFSDLTDIDEPVHFKLKVNAPRFVSQAPEGLIIASPRDFFESAQSIVAFASMESRRHDVLLGNPRKSALVVRYEFPDDFEVKTVPEARELETPFGNLRIQFEKVSAQSVVAKREFELRTHRIETADYEAFRDLSASLEQLRNEKIILEQKS